ncbi:hypothetical protein [Legionella sp.]|uniref:hypothetical protein n=1 Tax=Legionella sp. TaxID=459 RepID=UPI003D109CFC
MSVKAFKANTQLHYLQVYGIIDNEVITSKDFERLLSLYNRKSLSSQVSGALGLKNGELPDMVVQLAKGAHRDEIIGLLKKYFGNFAQHMTQ